MMRLRQFVPILFRDRSAEEPKRNPAEKTVAVPLARCARADRATARLAALSSWQGGSFAPRCIPRTRSFAPWTSPDALRLLDFRPGGVSPSGHPTAVSAAASTRRAFVPSMDLQTEGDFALPLDTHRPAVRRLDQRQGFRAHGPRRGGVPCPRLPANPGRIGCAPSGGNTQEATGAAA
jgi:hypothetical protein